MLNLNEYLTAMLSLPGIPGNEAPVRDMLARVWSPFVDEVSSSRLGSLHAIKHGGGAEPRRRVMVTAHMDGVGMMVTEIIDGFIRFTDVGSLDARVLPGQEVTVHGRRDVPGVIVDPGERLLPADLDGRAAPMRYLFIDTGLTPDALTAAVQVGDPISYALQPLALDGDWLLGHTLDNRASLAAISICLEQLRDVPHDWDVWCVATVQEETTHAGAMTSAYTIQPDMAIVLDVTYGRTGENHDPSTFPLGEGPTLGIGPNIHPVLHQRFKRLAGDLEIPYQIEVLPGNSLTDAHALQVVAGGIPCMVIGIPLLNMHTPVEVAAVKDIQQTGYLVARWIEALGKNIVEPLLAEEPA